ncbi:MAG: hydrogenase iron-sulfur subunit [Dehalococcoidia bacterium]|nr:hydrogenase iron-sulfur subunit [Dehalococcoidia bacterium]MDD5493452.1 hydrogenase iron-sulfur subunit [Dehalococcoidia bacterium]
MNGQHAKIYLFYCANSVDSKELHHRLAHNHDKFKSIPLPCSGKIDALYLMKAFESGADGVAVVTCKYGECKYLEGNLRATKRVGAVEALLEELGLGVGRIIITQIGDQGIDKVAEEIDTLRQKVKSLPSKLFIEDESELDKE